jgi:CDP-diacylglycerol--glycerol-3-phosphate 3-phosphatidyltransferase
MIIALILDLASGWFLLLEDILIWAALILTVVSLVDYIVKNKEILTKGGM